jgi:hypothetical protein
MEAGFRKLQEMKQRIYLTFLGTLLACAKLEMGRTEDALNFLEELQHFSVESHRQLFVPDLHRLRAEALQRLDEESSDRGREPHRAAACGRTREGTRRTPASGVRPLHRRPCNAGSTGGQGAAR